MYKHYVNGTLFETLVSMCGVMSPIPLETNRQILDVYSNEHTVFSLQLYLSVFVIFVKFK
jgi:hypothetical protein